MNTKTYEALGYIGLMIMFAVLAYLILKLLGVFHFPGYEEVLTATLVGQLFYAGYTHKALKEIERRLQRMEKKLKI